MPNTPTIPIQFTFDDKTFQQMAAQMEKLYNDAKKFSDILKGGLNADTSKTTASLKNTVSEMDKLRNKMDDYNKQTSQATGIIHKMELQMKSLKIQQKLATNPDDVKRYQREMQKLNKDIAQAKNTTRGWGTALNSFQFKFNALGNIAANVSSGITNGITNAIRGAIRTTIEFEKSFAAVLTLMTAAQKAEFADVLKQNSIDLMTKYGLSIEEVNKATFDAVSAGIEMGDMFQFMDAASKLAVGGVTDLASSVKGLASLINAFNLDASEATQVAETLFQAQRFGITYIDEMVKSMGRLNTVAYMTGTSYKEMAAAFAAVTKSGLNTEESVTGLRNLFKSLLAPTKQAKDYIEFYNDSIKGLDIVYGATALKQKKFLGTLDELQKLYKAQPDAIAKIFKNIRGLTGAAGLLGDNYDRFRRIMEEVNDAQSSQESLNAAVEEQMRTMAKKIDIMKGKWEAFIISITNGEGVFGSVFGILIEAINTAVDALTPLNLEISNIKAGMADGADAAGQFFTAISNGQALLGKNEKERAKLVNNIIDAETESAKISRDNIQAQIDLFAKYGTTDKARIRYIEEYNSKLSDQSLAIRDVETKSEIANQRILKRELAYYNAYIAGLREKSIANEATILKIEEQEKGAAKKESDLLKQRLKARYEFEKSVLMLMGDGIKRQEALAQLDFEYNRDLIELTVEDEKEKYFLLASNFNDYLTVRRGILERQIDEDEAMMMRYRKAMSETFDLPDEDYIPDIPFDTAEVVNQTKKVDDWAEAWRIASDAIKQFSDVFVEAADKRLEAIQREIDASDERMRSLQADRDHEWERMQEGYANNYALKQRELADEKARNQQLIKSETEALQQKKKAANAQVAIESIIQTSSIITAGAKIVADSANKAGIFGLVIAIPLLATLIGSFLSFKANAAAATRSGFAEGVIDLEGAGTAKSDSIPANLSRGESVMTAEATKPNKKTLSFMQKNPNHPLFRMIEQEGVNNVFNKLSDEISGGWSVINNGEGKWDERMYGELKSIRAANDEMRNRPYSYTKGGKTYTIEGNQVTISTNNK